MANRWHVKSNGEMGICRAEPGNCPLQKDGAVHFSNPTDAVAHSEIIYENEIGLFHADTPETPNRSEFYESLSYGEHIEDRVESGDYIMFQDEIYRVVSLEEDEDGDPTIHTVDAETGDPRHIYLNSYTQEQLMLRGNGPLDPANPDSYDVEWDASAYMGSYINPGEPFLYDGKVYRADDWGWNRALLRTEIEAFDLATGQSETITIHQGSEPEVKFLKGTKYS